MKKILLIGICFCFNYLYAQSSNNDMNPERKLLCSEIETAVKENNNSALVFNKAECLTNRTIKISSAGLAREEIGGTIRFYKMNDSGMLRVKLNCSIMILGRLTQEDIISEVSCNRKPVSAILNTSYSDIIKGTYADK